MGWVLYNSNYGDINRTALWYAFEISLDNGSTWTKNDLFYKLYYTDSYVQIVTLLIGDQEFDSAKTLSAFALAFTLFVVTFVLNWIAYRNYKNAIDRLKQ